MMNFLKSYLKMQAWIIGIIAGGGLLWVLGEQAFAGAVGLTIFEILCFIGIAFFLMFLWRHKETVGAVLMVIITALGIAVILAAITGKGKK